MPEVELTISFPESGTQETLLVTAVGQNVYRLEESSFCGDVFYRDIIEIAHQSDGTNLFKRMISRSGFKVTQWVLGREIAESEALTALLARIMALGGNWERLFKGILIVHLPLDTPMDINQELDQLASPRG